MGNVSLNRPNLILFAQLQLYIWQLVRKYIFHWYSGTVGFILEMHRLRFSDLTCRYRFLPIPIFFLRTIIDSIYKQKSMQISTKNDLHNKIKYKKITIPPIWTNLQIFSHLHNSQNKVLCDWKVEDKVNLKWVALCNETNVITHCL